MRKTIIKGSFWLFSLKAVNQVFSFVRLIILARLLAPAAFGVLGICLLAISTAEYLLDNGFFQALIQRENVNDQLLNTAWTIQILRGVAIGVLLYLLAPLIAQFYQEPQVGPLLQLLMLYVAVKSFQNIGAVFFRREMDFRKEFVMNIAGTTADFVVAVATTLIFRDVWCLVAGIVAGAAAMTIASYVLHPYRPRPQLSQEHFRQLFRYGRWASISNISSFISLQGDDAFVGWYFNATALGIYQMAFRLTNLAGTEIAYTTQQVIFPALSKLQRDVAALANAVVKSLQLSSWLSCVVAVGIWAVAPEFATLFLNPEWAEIVPVINVLAVAGALRSIAIIGGMAVSSAGVPRWNSIMNLVRLGVIVVTIVPLSQTFGLIGAGYAVLLGLVALYPVMLVGLARVLQIPARASFGATLPALVGSAATVAVIVLFSHVISFAPIVMFILKGAVAVLVYAITTIASFGSLRAEAQMLVWAVLSKVAPRTVVPLAGQSE